MKFDTLIKYVLWVVFFVMILVGLYAALRKIGVLG